MVRCYNSRVIGGLPKLSLNRNGLQKSAEAQGFSYIDGDTNPSISSSLERGGRELKRRTNRTAGEQVRLISSIFEVRSKSSNSDEAIARSYDQEYGGEKPKYGYVSALLSPEGFDLITGIPKDKINQLRVLDVGAGSNEFLRFCRDELAIPANQLSGSDVSGESTKIIENDGFSAHQGRIETLDLPERSFDLVYLSYFIDYDTDQAATFGAAIDRVPSGGKIVLEGWFPVRPFGLLEKDRRDYSFITKGKTAEEDIQLVRDAFQNIGKEKGRTVSLEKVVKTHRFVHSQYGFCKLDSYFLTFSVND
ncbi:MAG: hypothetical protein ABA06_01405 [Parcubacteria bacterium C7867-001]|nr:MAG: hypothetical protein ABA06_01405 [Parcubacteria bacterium C7867-001]